MAFVRIMKVVEEHRSPSPSPSPASPPPPSPSPPPPAPSPPPPPPPPVRPGQVHCPVFGFAAVPADLASFQKRSICPDSNLEVELCSWMRLDPSHPTPAVQCNKAYCTEYESGTCDCIACEADYRPIEGDCVPVGCLAAKLRACPDE